MPGLRKLTGDPKWSGRSRSGPPISTSRTATCSRASCWSAMRSGRRVRRPAPAPARCSPTSSGFATCYIPQWFATDGMGADKIAAFYADPVKSACDRHSFDKAFSLRSMSIDEGLSWTARRWMRFLGRSRRRHGAPDCGASAGACPPQPARERAGAEAFPAPALIARAAKRRCEHDRNLLGSHSRH